MPVILSGGFGTRLWPASRKRQPKQLLPLVDERTMFRATVDRLAALDAEPPVVVCNEDHRLAIEAELRAADVTAATIITEPVGRNTAPAVAVAAMDVLAGGTDPTLLVLPADHVIADATAFAAAVKTASSLAVEGWLVTFGIEPTRPDTGYGYIERGEALAEDVNRLARFVEKPDRATAQEYVNSGNYLWNSGMFAFTASRYLEELEQHRPDMIEPSREALATAERENAVIALGAQAFSASPTDSVDYAVMERTDRAAVVPLRAGWNDVGSWLALWEIAEHDADGNVLLGDVWARDVGHSLIRSTGRLIGAIGIEDMVVIDAPDALLVTKRERSQEVKDLVGWLRERNRPEFESDGSERQPWGTLITLAEGPGFRVRRLELDPGADTQLQQHPQRAEHFVVVRGVAQVHHENALIEVAVNESVFIGAGEEHSLTNAEAEPLVLIRVEIETELSERIS